MLLYCYDLKIKGKIPYNTLKRRFYYQLKKTKLGSRPWKSKSVLLVENELGEEADDFFKQWKPNILVFKATISNLQKI